MADAALRDAERSWVADRSITQEATLIQACQRSGLVTKAEIELAAYLGHEPAREMIPNCPCWSGSEGTRNYHTWKGCGLMSGSLENWISNLSTHLADVPAPKGLTKACPVDQESKHRHRTPGWRCSYCGGSGRVPLNINPQRYYSVVIGEAVAWVCLDLVKVPASECSHKRGPARWECSCRRCRPARALNAAGTWLKEPTEERARALTEAAPDNPTRMARMLRDLALLVRETSAFGPILISADAFGADVKAIAREAILPRLRLPPHHHQETHD